MLQFISKLDYKTKALIIASIVIGVLTAVSEYFFIGALQLFLIKIELLVGQTDVLDYFQDSSVKTSLILIVSAALLRAIFQALRVFISRLAQVTFGNYLRNEIVYEALHKNSNHSTGKIVSMLSDDVQRASNSVLNFSSLVISLFTAATIFVFIVKDSFQLFVISCAILLILFIPQLLINKWVKNSGSELSNTWNSTSSTILDAIRNKFYLITYGLIENETFKTKQLLDKYLSIYQRTFAVISIKTSYITFIGILTVVIVSFYQYENNLIHNKNILITYLYLFLRFSQALAQTNTIKTEFQINFVSLDKLNEVFRKNKNDENSPAHSIESLQSISVKNMFFSFDNNKLLENMDLSFEKGKPIGITGRSGSGKSTLISLILGLETPTKGSILINNSVDASHSDNSYLNQLAYIGPSPYLIEGTVRDNLLYANPKMDEITIDNIDEALEMAELKSHVYALNHNLDSKVSENISTFSTGQKQRLMIARAILRNPNFIIMDEATSNLDDETEAKIIENLRCYLQTRLAIIVTHKEKPLSICSETISLD
jgi:ABC-type multidrug transport system fused ATPase/permease subunit